MLKIAESYIMFLQESGGVGVILFDMILVGKYLSPKWVLYMLPSVPVSSVNPFKVSFTDCLEWH